MTAIPIFLRKYFSCCLHCGCFFPLQGLLCESCEACLLGYRSETSDSKIKLRTLLRWSPGESDICSKLVRTLKGAHGRSAWRYYAFLFMQHNYADLSLSYDHIFIVPAPSKNESCHQHAYYWAEGLAEAAGGDIFSGLRLDEGSESQKSRSRGERALVGMHVHVNSTIFESIEGKVLWVFADDVYTTGATARAAYEALGRPVNFEVWTLAERTLSCGG